jgi:copper chaperone CopZ
MNVDCSYVHALEGRLRIKIPKVKGAAGRAQEVERHLRQFSGVEDVSANPITGNVLILYDSRLTEQGQIFSALKEKGYLTMPNARGDRANHPDSAPQGLVEKVTATVAATLMEVALSRLVGALI